MTFLMSVITPIVCIFQRAGFKDLQSLFIKRTKCAAVATRKPSNLMLWDADTTPAVLHVAVLASYDNNHGTCKGLVRQPSEEYIRRTIPVSPFSLGCPTQHSDGQRDSHLNSRRLKYYSALAFGVFKVSIVILLQLKVEIVRDLLSLGQCASDS